MKYLLSLLIALAPMWTWAQGRKIKSSTAGHYTYDCECRGLSKKGNPLVQSLCGASDKKEARTCTAKEALHTVLFNGIKLGDQGCESKPMVYNMNAESEFADFFKKLYFDSDYQELFIKEVESVDRPKKQQRQEKNTVVYGFVYEIYTDRLQKELLNKGIITKSIE